MFQDQQYRIEVLKWNAATTPEQVDLYITIGTSEWPTGKVDHQHRTEFFVGLLPGRDEVASQLAALGLYQAREATVLHEGDPVPSDKPLWPSTAMRHFLIARPLSSSFQPVDIADGSRVDLLQALPVFEAEVAFKATHGMNALMRMWEQANVPFWDPDRTDSIGM